mmetsp:Transcript_836/g.1093  ORF Transcript_836/g.1093 Transcript_836/m.1093 type:complete len:499 (-) Transcript_836:101-1597(-)
MAARNTGLVLNKSVYGSGVRSFSKPQVPKCGTLRHLSLDNAGVSSPNFTSKTISALRHCQSKNVLPLRLPFRNLTLKQPKVLSLLQQINCRSYHGTPRLLKAVSEAEVPVGGIEEDVQRGREKVLGTVLGEVVYDAKQKRKKIDNPNELNTDLHKNYFVTAIKGNAIVRETIKFMVDRQVGSLMILDQDNKVQGLVTEHDIVFKYFQDQDQDQDENENENESKSTDVNDLPIESIMTTDVICSKMGASLFTGLEIMNQHGFRHLPIVSDKVKNNNESESAALTVLGNNTSISDYLHIISVKGLLSRFYKDITGLGLAPIENVEERERTEVYEVNLSSLQNFPIVKQMLQQKVKASGGRSTVLNTDIVDQVTVADVIPEMKRSNGASLAVLSSAESGSDENSHPTLVGIVTERDILHGVLYQGKIPEDVLVEEIMTKATEENPLKFVTSRTSLLTCIRLIATNDIRHLPVTDKSGKRILGMLSAKDIVRAVCDMRIDSV